MRVTMIAMCALAIACRMQEEPGPSPHASSSAASARGRVRIVKAAGDVAATVRRELASAKSERRDVLVYVGATWCEPCQRFHAAAEHGELDAAFPTLTLVEFDVDRDGKELAAAGYVSQMIPLFAVPGDDGRGTGKQIEGSIKGPGAVAEIAPRLRQLVGR